MAVSPVSSSDTLSAAGLDFQSLLKIILTQLTYQDPLKPLDNFQFVSQLAQFAQLQQSQTLNDSITSLLSSQATSQAVGLLGRTVDVTDATTGTSSSGTVQSISFSSGTPEVTMETSDGQTVANISIADVIRIR